MTPAEQAARALDQCSRAAHMNESEQSACCQCVASALAQARREEREACAAFVGAYITRDLATFVVLRQIAAAIRARAQEE